VDVWDGDARVLDGIAAGAKNPLYLTDVELPSSVAPCHSMADCIAEADIILLTVPAQAMRGVCLLAKEPLLGTSATLVSASKGLEVATGARMSQVIASVLGEEVIGRLVALSGPNLAGEMSKLMPAATVVAGNDPSRIAATQAALSMPALRVYASQGVAGVEFGGALKNIIAVAAGMTDGLGYGDNTKASLMTRGLAEITRLGIAHGAQAGTFMGLSGLGDLVATCSSRSSRNWRVGNALAQGKTFEQASEELGMVAEGPPTSKAALHLAKGSGVEMPITARVHAILYEGESAEDAARALMSRPLKNEWSSEEAGPGKQAQAGRTPECNAE
jgi:glycerol-3-phosphate dehydrogenase (NAD(P)+)